MRRPAFAAGAVVFALAAAPAAPHVRHPAASPSPRPTATASPAKVHVELPGDLAFAFKPGPGATVASSRCLTCHSTAYVSTQPPLDRARWDAEVTKMRKAYGAPMTDEEAATIVDYLVAAYGPAP